jgi:hypothetical protein
MAVDHTQGQPGDGRLIGGRALHDRAVFQGRHAGRVGGGHPLLEVVGHG